MKDACNGCGMFLSGGGFCAACNPDVFSVSSELRAVTLWVQAEQREAKLIAALSEVLTSTTIAEAHDMARAGLKAAKMPRSPARVS